MAGVGLGGLEQADAYVALGCHRAAFAVVPVYDSKGVTPEPAERIAANHPLAADPELLGRLIELMQATIQKVLRFGPDSRAIGVEAGRLAPRVTSSSERSLAGGESVDDILQDALLSLLRTDPDKVRSWKDLAQRVAHDRAVDAIRRATKGRRAAGAERADGRDAIGLSSVDGLDLDTMLGGAADATEDEYLRTEQQLVLRRVARQLLSPRDLKIFYEIHFSGSRRAPLAQEFDISEVRVSQIYVAALRTVRAGSRDDPAFSEPDENEGRTT